MIIKRSILRKLNNYSQIFPAIGIVGPRQVGKTTLVKEFIKTIDKKAIYLDLELPTDLDKLKDPEIFLTQNINNCVVIDEVQNKPELFPLLRALIDQQKEPLRFIILGSANPQLLRQSSESLAGRIGYLELDPFNYTEIKDRCTIQHHHFIGGFPNAVLATQSEQSSIWIENLIRTYVERDLQLFGISADPSLIRRLWEMLAWTNGSLINLESLSKSLSVSYHTVNRYIGFFENAYLVRKLLPFHYNMKKRLVKSPKIYLTDTGILHKLLRISDYNQLLGHTSVGASWEAYVINQIHSLKNSDFDLYFYRTHNGAEVDLVFVKALQPVATAEIKFTSTPHPTKGLLNCIEDLGTVKNYIITPFSDDYLAKENIRVCNLPVFIEKYLQEL